MLSNELKQQNNDNDANTNAKDIKILFLDVDGVLNRMSLFIWFDNNQKNDNNDNNASQDKYITDKVSGLSIVCLKRLKTIINKTDCYIVLSSAWRKSENSKKTLFKAMQLKDIEINVKKRYIGDTPTDTCYRQHCSYRRVFEINEWLKNSKIQYNYNVTHWCAIDDLPLDIDDDAKTILNGHFVNTDGEKGITDSDMNEVISILSQ